MDNEVILSGLIFLAAALYAAVGHGGASGYLAAMALFGLAPEAMRPAALTLNVFVACIGCYKYIRVGRFSWSLFWPFAVVSVPCAFIGGLLYLPAVFYKPIVGGILLYSAFYFFKQAEQKEYPLKQPRLAIVLCAGAVLGLLSGLVGVGGGIFLSPLIIMLHWQSVKKVSGIAAAFILVNSLAGIAGYLSTQQATLPDGLLYWVIAAVVGGYLGAEYGSKRLQSPMIKRLLAVVLSIAGVKMFLTL